MSTLQLTRDKFGNPKRMIVESKDTSRIKDASFGTANYSKKGWTLPVEPWLAERIAEIDGIELSTEVRDMLEYYDKKRYDINTSLGITAPLEPNDRLMKFQRASVRFLETAKRAILGHKMGTGKTVIASAATKHLNAQRVMVVCPASVKWYWADTMREFGGWKHCHVVESGFPIPWMWQDHYRIGYKKKEDRDSALAKNLKQESICLIINYELLTKHMPTLVASDYDVVIIDEAHRIKNRKRNRTQSCIKIANRAEYAWLLTGTPVRNDYDDLWTMLHVCDPIRFASYWNFVKTHLKTAPNYFGGIDILGIKDQPRFSDMLSIYMYAKTKEEVMPEMPPKLMKNIKLEMSLSQKKVYNKLEEEFILLVKEQMANGEELEKILRFDNTLTQYMKLRQVCLAPDILGSGAKSAKVDALKDIADGLKESGEQAIFFTNFKRFIPHIQKVLRDNDISFNTIVGGMNTQDHRLTEQALERGAIQAVVGTIGAMGESLNLQSATVAVFCDRDWVPAVNEQAEDRIHRGNIQNSPTIINLYHPNSIDEDIMAVCERKKRIEKETVGRVEVLRRMMMRKEG